MQYEDDGLINAGDTITFNLTPDKNSILNKVLKQVENVQELGESLALRYMISPYYIQYPDAEGNFNNNEEPSNWFKKMYAVTTTWQIMFNTESVYFRTEGSLAGVNRSSGIQSDAGRNATGYAGQRFTESFGTGAFYSMSINGSPFAWDTSQPKSYRNLLDLSRVYTTANEFRVKNRLIRIYKLLTINGKKVSDIIGV